MIQRAEPSPSAAHDVRWRAGPFTARLAVGFALAIVASSALARSDALLGAMSASRSTMNLRERDHADALAALQRAELGLSASLDVSPSLELTGAADNPKVDTALEPSIEARLRAGYRFDAASILAARINLHKADVNLQDERRQAILQALRAQVAELRAGYALEEAQADARTASLALSEGADAYDSTDLTDGQLHDLQLDAQLANTALARARRDLADSKAALDALGVPPLDRVPDERFVLPVVDPADTARVQLADLELQRTKELSSRKTLFGIVDNVQLIGGYAGSDAAAYASMSLDNGRPGANVDLQYRYDKKKDTWVVGLGATLRVDDRTFDTFARAARDVDDASDARAQAIEVAHERIASTFERAADAREDLDAAATALENSDLRLRELQADVEHAVDTDATQRTVDRANTALTRRQGTFTKQQDRLARAWDAYVVAVSRYLTEIGGDWSIE